MKLGRAAAIRWICMFKHLPIIVLKFIYIAQAQLAAKLSHHEKHEDHKGKTELIFTLLRVLRAIRGYSSNKCAFPIIVVVYTLP